MLHVPVRPQIRALLLDFGNVIAPFSFDRFFARVAHFSPFTETALRFILFESGLHARFERGEIGPAAFVADIMHRFGLDEAKIDYAMFARWRCDIFLPSDDLALDRLLSHVDRSRSNIGLVSNTDAIVYERMIHMHPIVHRHIPYEYRTLSHKVGAMKPDPAIFDDALGRLRVRANEALLVDDVSVNADAFRSMGGHAIVWNAQTATVDALETALEPYGIFKENAAT